MVTHGIGNLLANWHLKFSSVLGIVVLEHMSGTRFFFFFFAVTQDLTWTGPFGPSHRSLLELV